MIGGITVLTDLNPWVVSLPPARARWRSSALAVLFLHRLDHRARRAGRAAPSPALAWATFAVDLGWCSTLGTVVTGSGPHAGDAKAAAQRPRPAPGQPAPRRPGLPVRRPDRSACWFAVRGRRRPDARPRRVVAARGRGRPGRDRLRAVLHRPARSCWSASTCSAPRWSAAAAHLAADLGPRAGRAGTHGRRSACTPVDGPTVVPLRRPGHRFGLCGPRPAQRVSSGSSATATKSSER